MHAHALLTLLAPTAMRAAHHRNSHGYDVAVRWRAKFTHVSAGSAAVQRAQAAAGCNMFVSPCGSDTKLACSCTPGPCCGVQISPVWYQLRTGSGGNSFELVGSHNVDREWLAKLRVPITKVWSPLLPGCSNGSDTACLGLLCSCEWRANAAAPMCRTPAVLRGLPGCRLR